MSEATTDPVDQALDMLREHRDEFTDGDDFVASCIGHLLDYSPEGPDGEPPQVVKACRVLLERADRNAEPGRLSDAQSAAVFWIGEVLTALADLHDSASDRQGTALGYLFEYQAVRADLDRALTDYEATLRTELREEVLR